MGWLVLEDKDWHLLTNQLMRRVEDKETHICCGQPSLISYLSF
jgi:hypothetical protein